MKDVSIIEVLIDELDERRESQYWLQLRLLERELRLMFAVLEHIECLERPSGYDMVGPAYKPFKQWLKASKLEKPSNFL